MQQQQVGTPSKKVLKSGTAQRGSSSTGQGTPSIGRVEIGQVETGIPVPPRKYNRQSKYPFGTMLPGQSVLISGKSYSAIIGVLRLHKAKGKVFTVRTEDGGVRVWRD
jgi:hypothetical protein